MTDKTMLNFRCPSDLLDAIDAIGQQRYPSETAKHGCDRSKTLLDIVRAGIEALSENPSVLQVSDNNVRYRKTKILSPTEEPLGKSESLSESDVEALRHELAEAKAENQRYEEAFQELEGEKEDVEYILREAKAELEALKNTQPSVEFELPEPDKAYNELKGQRPKSKADMNDVKVLWEIIEKSRHNRGN